MQAGVRYLIGQKLRIHYSQRKNGVTHSPATPPSVQDICTVRISDSIVELSLHRSVGGPAGVLITPPPPSTPTYPRRALQNVGMETRAVGQLPHCGYHTMVGELPHCSYHTVVGELPHCGYHTVVGELLHCCYHTVVGKLPQCDYASSEGKLEKAKKKTHCNHV